jgi:hypothetical protein
MPLANGVVVASVVKEYSAKYSDRFVHDVQQSHWRTFRSLDHVDAIVDKAEGMGKLVECLQRLLYRTEAPRN